LECFDSGLGESRGLIDRLNYRTGQRIRLLSGVYRLGTKSRAQQLLLLSWLGRYFDFGHDTFTFCVWPAVGFDRTQCRAVFRSAHKSSTSSLPTARRTVCSVISPA